MLVWKYYYDAALEFFWFCCYIVAWLVQMLIYVVNACWLLLDLKTKIFVCDFFFRKRKKKNSFVSMPLCSIFCCCCCYFFNKFPIHKLKSVQCLKRRFWWIWPIKPPLMASTWKTHHQCVGICCATKRNVNFTGKENRQKKELT